MNDEKREAMIAAANADIDNHDWYNYPEEFAADFALEQMRPLADRIAELERQLAVADSAMHEMLRCFGDQRTQCTNEYLDAVDGLGNALAQIRGGAATGKPDEAEVMG